MRDVGLASLAYFYFDSQDIEKQNVRNFLTSLLTQLAASSENCRNIILRLYAKHGNGTQQPHIGALTNCLHEMLLAAARQPTYIIVDALDECPNMTDMPTPRETVLSLLKGLVDLCVPNLHICVTSRLEIDIKIALGPLAYGAVSLHDERSQQRDIANYVGHVVYSDRNMREWQESERELIANELSRKADGM